MKITTYNPIKNTDCCFDSDSFFDNSFPFGGSMVKSIEPRVNIKDENGAFFIEASVAGYNKDEINLEMAGDTLTLSGSKKENKKTEDDGYRKKEFFCSNFNRSFSLTEEVDRENISAEVDNGILTVKIPKKEKTQPKKIQITVN